METWIAEVAFPLPLDKPYDYSVPPEFRPRLRPGMRVRAPLGPRRSFVGVVFSLRLAAPDRELKGIEAVIDDEPALSEEMLELSGWLASRYCARLGECLRLLLPGVLGEKGGFRLRTESREAPGGPPPAGGFEMTPSQAAAVESLSREIRARAFSAHLLFGVPASGKTEVYLRIIREALKTGGQALFLVPEISLSLPFFEHFARTAGGGLGGRAAGQPPPVALWHSQLGARERRGVWLGLRSGAVRVAVGPRSACLLPFKDLRLAVLDEEQDESFKQDGKAPYYHARDVVLERARRFGAVVVLGSATPSLESWERAEAGALGLVRMPERVWGGTGAPAVRIVSKPAAGGCFGLELVEAVRERLRRREQSILLVNRRGFSNFAICRRCGWVSRCPDCEVAFIHHREEGGFRMRCHHCGRSAGVPDSCGKCGRPDLNFSGIGTQRVVSEIRRLLPGLRVLRMDRDSVGEDDAIHRRFRDGEADVLVGTKLAAKGFHFPRVTLVGVVDADTLLQMPDFRAAERTVQFLIQAAGRSGRAEMPGQVLLQTSIPTHYAIQAVARGDYDGFCRRELGLRKELRYPPASALVRLVFSGKTASAVRGAAEASAESLRKAVPSSEVVGPAPGILKKFAGSFRFHLLVKAGEACLPEVFQAVKALAPPSSVRLKVNVDPYDFV
jgi:primosomal protein N' (replication factor Y)